MPRKNALSRAKSSIVTDSLRITQSSGLDRHAVYARQRVDEFRNDDIASTQSARQAKDATDLVVEPDRQYAKLIRRLTPGECELLQGLPAGVDRYPVRVGLCQIPCSRQQHSCAVRGIHDEKPASSCRNGG